MTNLFRQKKAEEITLESMEQRRRNYEEYAVYVTDEEARKAMLAELASVTEAINAKDPIAAKSRIEIVKHIYSMARFRNKVLKYKSTTGGFIAFSHLVLLCSVFAVGYYYLRPNFSSTDYKVLLAIVGGGLGGIAIVILGLIGAQVQTSAAIHRHAWFLLKPISGYIMGLVTYCAVDIGAQTLANSTSEGGIAKPFAVFLIGFLGGFFETFSNKALLRAANLDKG